MTISISPLIDLSISALCFFCAWKLYGAYKKDTANKVIEYFFKAYVMAVVAYLFFSLPRIIMPDQSFYLGVGFIIAQLFLFIATAYLAMVTTFFIDPLRYKISFWLFMILAIVVIILFIIYFGMPVYDKKTGITDWHIDPIAGIASSVLFLTVLLPSTIYFFSRGVCSHNKIVRVRSLLISIGFILLMIATYTFYQASSETQVFVSDLFSLSSFLVIFLGVYYKRGTSLKEK